MEAIAAWCPWWWTLLLTADLPTEPDDALEMLSHLKSRNGYGMADINPKDEEEEEKEADVNAKTEEEKNATVQAELKVVADESSEAADSSLNSEIEDIEISAEPEPGTDGSTFSEEESEEEKEEKQQRVSSGEKRKRDEQDSEGGEEQCCGTSKFYQ